MGRKKGKVKAARKRTDREKLDLFVERAEELGRIDLVRNGIGYSHTFSWSRTDGMRSTLEEPPEGELRSVLLELRKFIADDSDIWLNRMHGIVYQHLRPTDARVDEYRDALSTMNRKWRDAFEKGLARVTINGILVSPEHAWDAWINGEYFHDDMDHRTELSRLGPFKDSHRAQFLEAVISTLKYTNWLARNVVYFLHNDLLDLQPE